MTDEPQPGAPTALADGVAEPTSPLDPSEPSPPRRPEPPTRGARGAERRRRRRRTLFVLLAVGALVLVPVLAVGGWFAWQVYLPFGGPSSDRVEVVIEPGWSTSQVADSLVDAGVVDSALAFRIWARLQGATFQAGTYSLSPGVSVSDAVDDLERGPDTPLASNQAKLLVPPGLTLSQIADRVGALPGHTRDAFLQTAASGVVRSKYQPAGVTSLEGLTWPDTYFIGEGQTDEEILRTIVAAFDAEADAVGLADAAASGAGLTPYETVVVASLVQGEAAPADARAVAGVIVNRLRAGMPLQIDATLCYAKGGCPPVPTNADKQIDSAYNTYRVTGLPPTPILTVTESSLRAALAPASHNDLFYVTGKDGVTRFAETLAGHEENIRLHGVRGE